MDVSFSLPVAKLLLYVYAFIATSSAIGFLHPKLRRPERKPIRQAINSWWPPALIGGVALVFGNIVAVTIFFIVSVWALREYLDLLAPENRPRFVVGLVYTGAVLHYLGLWVGHPFAASGTALAFWCTAILPLGWALRHGPAGMLTGIGRIILGVLVAVFALGHIARLFLLPKNVGTFGPSGLAYLLLVSVMINDASQYILGKLFGRHACAPIISPKKTWEGLIGGIVVTSLVSAKIMPVVAPVDHLVGALVGAGLAGLGVLGDLLVSAMKRDVGVKDTGVVLPGQGGLLDRMDSFILSAPLYYHGIAAWFS